MLSLNRSSVGVAMASLLLATLAAHAQAPRYHLVDLGSGSNPIGLDGQGQVIGFQHGRPSIYAHHAWTTLEGSTREQPRRMNGHDEVVGTRIRDKNGDTAIYWTPDGQYHVIVRGALHSFGMAIQPDGTLYGAAILPSGHEFPFSSKDGVLTHLPYDPDWSWTMPTAVNRSGHMSGFVGNSDDGDEIPCPMDPAMFDGTQWITLGSLGGSCGQANAINDADQVVGWSFPPGDGNGHAFLYDGTLHDLGTLGGVYAEAMDINAQGWIVGGSTNAAGDMHPFVWIAGAMYDLTTLVDKIPHDASLVTAVQINSSGQILVQGSKGFNRLRGFLLNPM